MSQTMTVERFRVLGERTQLVDVRSATEFAAGHIPSAVNIPMEQIEGRLADLDAGCKILLVCQGGGRAGLVASLLERCGRNVAVLEGGTAAWIKEGLPVVTSVKTRWSLERQVRLGAGVLVLAGVVLGTLVSTKWTLLSGFAGLGLIFAGMTDICPMAALLSKLPWNRGSQCTVPTRT